MQHVGDAPATAVLPSSATSATAASSVSSRERRSMTVALDQHPLAALSIADRLGLEESTGVDPSVTASPATPWPRVPMFSTDLESPSRAPEREMDLVVRSAAASGTGAARHAYHDAQALRPFCSDGYPLGKLPAPNSHRHDGGGAQGGSDATGAVVSLRKVAQNGASASEGSRSGAASHKYSGAASPLQPTPYPVTSASSLQDWSSAPRLGFPAPCESAVVRAEAATQHQRDAEERKREDKWYRLCRGVSLLASAAPDSIVKLRVVAREVGIPHHLRGVMWLTLTGMALKVDENEYFCAQLLRRNGYVTGSNADVIAADVQRTFPGHPYFSDTDVGIYKLTNVLHALCWRNPLLTYCQSFNFLAAFLLLVLDDEERAFWLLVYVFEALLPNDFYGETLIGANVEQAVLEHLVDKRLPRVAAKFRSAGLQVHTLVANWIMSLFVNVFPTATTLRLWDYIFCRTPNPGERTPAHLEITLATLKYLDEAGLLGCSSGDPDAGELLVALRHQTACLFDAAALIRNAQALAITPAELHQLRRQSKPAVVEHMKAREQARAVQQERRIALELQHARAKAGAAPTQS